MDLAGIRGEMVQQRPEHVKAKEEFVTLPQSLLTNNRVVTLCADVFFVNRLPFLISLSMKVGLTTVEFTSVNGYHRAGFTVRMIVMDGEFESIRDLMPQITLKIMAAKEHVSQVELQIRTKGKITKLSYKMLPHKMVVHLMYFMT